MTFRENGSWSHLLHPISPARFFADGGVFDRLFARIKH